MQAELFGNGQYFLQLYDADGVVTLNDNAGPIVGLDESRIYFQSFTTSTEYYAVDHSGNNLELVFAGTNREDLTAFDGSRAGGVAVDETTGFADIVVVDFSTGQRTVVASTGSSMPSPVSLGGGIVAYFGADGLHVVDIDGTNDRALPSVGRFPFLVTPDGAHVVTSGQVFDVATATVTDAEDGGPLVGIGRTSGRVYFSQQDTLASRKPDGTDPRIEIQIFGQFGANIALSTDERTMAVDRAVGSMPYRQFMIAIPSGDDLEVAAAQSGPTPGRFFLP